MSTVKNTYVKRSASTKANLVCCRACLATDGKLYNMDEYQLLDAFARISGISTIFQMEQDQLPHHLCVWCATLLQRYTSFQAKCERAQRCLTAGLMQKNLTMEYVLSIDRIANKFIDLMHSGVNTTIIEPEDVKDIISEQLLDIDNNIDTNINKDKDSTTDINRNNDKDTTNKIDTKKDENCTEYIKDTYDLNLEFKECKSEFDLDNGNVDLDNQVEDIGGFIVKDVDEIVRKKTKTARKVRNRTRKKNCENVKKSEKKDNIEKEKPKKPIYREQRIFRTDSAKFESTCNVKIVTLTKEEQLQEIEARKKSDKYLDALFPCEECGKGFQVEAAFNNHRKKHDPSAGEHPCPICSVRFQHHYILLRHRETHRTQIVCQDCGFISRSRPQASNHYKMHKGKEFCCGHCGKTYRTTSCYLTHVRLRHPTEHVSCDMCGEMFIGIAGLRQHKSVIHSVYMNKKYKCTLCSTVFISPVALQRHLDSGGCGQLSPCHMCGDSLPGERMMLHTAEHHPRCDECRQTFVDAAAYRTHHTRKHLGVPYDALRAGAVRVRVRAPRRGNTTRKYMCEYCGKMQPCQAILLEHRRRHENVKPFACPECPKTFCSVTQYKAHMRTHTGERPFQCDHCSQAFALKKNMERHILNRHLGKGQKVPCVICGRCFTTPSSVRLHARTVHGGERAPRRDRRPRPRPQPDPAGTAQ